MGIYFHQVCRVAAQNAQIHQAFRNHSGGGQVNRYEQIRQANKKESEVSISQQKTAPLEELMNIGTNAGT